MPAVRQGQPNQHHKHELSAVPKRDDIIVGPFAVMVPFCKWVDVYLSAVLVHYCKWINDGHHAFEPLRDWSLKCYTGVEGGSEVHGEGHVTGRAGFP